MFIQFSFISDFTAYLHYIFHVVNFFLETATAKKTHADK
jgi:hypothetical protein